jgi:protein-S-isoprenylcysteine O-methyltransferase Ste14
MALCATSFSEGVRLGVGIAMILPLILLLLITRHALGSSFAVMAEAKVLVTNGPYARIQHPMYFFLDLILLDLIVIFNVPLLLSVWGIIVVIQILQAGREEKVLAAAFGSEYEGYKNHTWF